MRPLGAALVLIASLLAAGAARAGPRELERDFGGPPLGAKLSQLPRPLKREPSCTIKPRFVDCELTGPGGMHYVLYGELYEKQVRRLERGRTRWPYGLSGRESPEDVSAMLRDRYRLKPDFQLDGADHVVSVVTDPRAPCNIYFTFDRRGLKAVSHRCSSEAD